jgi:MYXO-CTERM domain-containing protein
MIPTGSTSEPSWRTRAGGLARGARWGWCAAVLLLAARAQATWHPPRSVPGKPNEVLEVWGPETFSLGWSHAGTQYASLFAPGRATSLDVKTGELAGTYYQASRPSADACLVSVNRSGARMSFDAMGKDMCGGIITNSSIVAEAISDLPRLKRGTQGGLAALVPTGGTMRVYMSLGEVDAASGPPVMTSAKDFDVSLTSQGLAFGVTRIASKAHVFFAVPSGLADGVWVSSEATDQDVPVRVSDATARIEAVELFTVRGSTTPYAVIGAGPFFIQGSRTGGLKTLSQPLPNNFEILGLSMNVEAGGDGGAGFGMAVVQRANKTWSLMSARPMKDEAQAGTEWVERPEVPLGLGSATDLHVACFGARACVFTDSRSGGDNIFVYSNDATPRFEVDAPPGVTVGPTEVKIDEAVGKAPVSLTFRATDDDGDPLRFGFEPRLTPGDGWSVDTVSPYTRRITLTGPLCRTKSGGTFELEASDGLKAHEVARALTLTLEHTQRPTTAVKRLDGQPVLDGEPLGTLTPTSGPLTLQVEDSRADQRCRVDSRKWSSSGPGAPGVEYTWDTVTLKPSCAAEERDSPVFLDVADEGGLHFMSTFTVHQPGWESLAAKKPQLELGLDASDPTRLRGRVGSPAVGCARERALGAEVWLETETGDRLEPPQHVDVPGTWTLSRPASCGRFRVKARLVDSTGATSLEEARPLELAGPGVAINPPTEARLVATCGERARLVLTPSFPAEACQTPDVSWAYTGGPATQVTNRGDGSAELLTEATDLESRVGETVHLSLRASMAGQGVSGPQSVRITAEPFVEVTRRTELPAASETELVGVSVDLFNTTDCDVTRVRHVEHLEGLSYVEGSARFNGEPPEYEQWNEATGQLAVEQLALPGQTTATLTYVARPRLVGERRLSGETSLREERISLDSASAPPPPGSGCGCTSTSSGSVLVALVTLAGAARRRRPTARS